MKMIKIVIGAKRGRKGKLWRFAKTTPPYWPLTFNPCWNDDHDVDVDKNKEDGEDGDDDNAEEDDNVDGNGSTETPPYRQVTFNSCW